MAVYITQGRYSASAMKGMATKPEDRRGAVEGLMKAAGFKLVAYYLTTGDYDFLVIIEGEGDATVLAPLIVASATGGVSGLHTIQAFTPTEFKTACEKAGKMMKDFKAAGAG